MKISNALHLISTMKAVMNRSFPGMQFPRLFLTEWNQNIFQIPFAKSYTREFTKEITLYLIGASLVGIAMAGMMILWIDMLFKKLGN